MESYLEFIVILGGLGKLLFAIVLPVTPLRASGLDFGLFEGHVCIDVGRCLVFFFRHVCEPQKMVSTPYVKF